MTAPDGRFDVLVVGAGPAGSSVALRAARAGARVALLDARAFPRSKPCGDCLSPGATPLLREMGVLPGLEAAGSARLHGWRTRTPAGTWFEGRFGDGQRAAGTRGGDRTDGAPGGDRTDGSAREDVGRRGRRAAAAGDGDPAPGGQGTSRPDAPPRVGLALPRRDLDAFLVEAAVEAGAVLRERTRAFGLLRARGRVAGVRARDREGRTVELHAPVVVGADGLRSVVARRLGGVRRGPRPRLALVGRFAGVEAPRQARRAGRRPRDAVGEMRLGRAGCLGMAPVGRGRWNATLVVPAGRARQIAADRQAFFRKGLEAYGVAHRFARAEPLGRLEITGPFQASPRRPTAPGALLAGDAAGYFDPLTGQGIHRALATGRAAARAALAMLDASGPAAREAARRRYEGELSGISGGTRRVQKLVDGVVRHPRLLEAVGRLLRARPALASLLVDVTGDRLPASSLLDPRRVGRGLVKTK